MSNNLIFPNFTCNNCQNKKDPQFVFNSILLTVFIVALSFTCSFALNSFLKEWFERMTPKCQELQAKFNYMILIFAFAIVVGFLLMYNLNGTKW
jgi:predicted Co/Zn/Cd cation transporter (cation efflux family)